MNNNLPPLDNTSQNNKAEPQQDQPKKSFPKWILALLAVLLVVLLGIGAYAATLMPQEPTYTSNTTPVAQTPAPTPTLDPTADWKTYTNSENGYSIEYPTDKISRIICPEEETLFTRTSPNFTDEKVMPTCARDSRYDIEITTYSQQPQLPTESECLSFIKEEATVSAYSATKYTTQPKEGENCGAPNLSGEILYYIENENKTYEIILSNSRFVSFELLHQILSTFHFTDITKNENKISWQEATSLIHNCEVEMVSQTHSLDVTLTLKDGTRATTKEPAIDDVFKVVKNAEPTCGTIPLATE